MLCILIFIPYSTISVLGIMCLCKLFTAEKKSYHPNLKVYHLTQNHFLSRFFHVRLFTWSADNPCKACAQSTGRNFEDKLMRFCTYAFQHKDEGLLNLLMADPLFHLVPIQISSRNRVFNLINTLKI